MAHCTVPLRFQPWFNARFKDICDYHDELYVTANIYLKFYGDFWVMIEFWKRKYRLLAIGSIFANLILGTLYWLLHRYDDAKHYLNKGK